MAVEIDTNKQWENFCRGHKLTKSKRGQGSKMMLHRSTSKKNEMFRLIRWHLRVILTSLLGLYRGAQHDENHTIKLPDKLSDNDLEVIYVYET